MTNLYPFIQGFLKCLFSKLVSSDASLWDQYKLMAFNSFSGRILIISCKILIITVIPNETTNKLTIYTIVCQSVIVFYQQELVSSFQVQGKLRACTS